MDHQRFRFPGSGGVELSGRLDLPGGPPRAYALFAHCFTCTKDSLAAARISGALAERGYGVLRFDFTGLGGSDGDFANSNFAGNIEDLVAAADHLRRAYQAPALLVGHSLGGTAMLAAAHRIPEARAVATIGAPLDPGHVVRHIAVPDRFDADGTAAVEIGGRPFRLARSFFDDLARHDLAARVAELRRALLVCHSPLDATVGIKEATRIFVAARHPKSFIGVDGADHLLSRREDGLFVGRVLGEWAERYVGGEAAPAALPAEGVVIVAERGTGRYAQTITAGHHLLHADEPTAVGGDDTGPSPYDLLLSSLGACTAMTLRMYAERKGLALGRIEVRLRHSRVHARDCAECENREGMIDRIERVIAIEGAVDEPMRAKLLEIADKCPVHRTLEARPLVVTRVEG